jgi:carotenoid cleavage dioxygenase
MTQTHPAPVSTAIPRRDALDLSPAADPTPFLEGNFAPVDREQTLLQLEVTGELPADLDGLLLRDGPNPVGPVGSKHHWFVGDGMLHGIELAGGRALAYRNRWIRTRRVEEVLGLPAAPVSPLQPALQASGAVNVISHAGRILALGEIGLPYAMSPALDTLEQYDFGGRLGSAMTAHPKIDPVNGELVFFGYDLGPVHLRYHVADARGALVRTLEIPTPRPTMMHDFGVTQTRVVFMDLPVVFDLELVAQGYALPYRWDDTHPARLGVMPRAGGAVQWIELPPCYVFHPLNAYDDGQRIVMDVVRYRRTFDIAQRGEQDVGTLYRWTIDPEAGRVSTAQLDDRGQEFPRVDPRRETLPHRYGYALEVSPAGGAFAFGSLLKHDLQRGTCERHDVGAGRAGGEPLFVPSGPGEDEGYVLATVYDARRDASDVLVLDARNFSQAPLATVHLPVRIPFGFHGNFVPRH